MATALPVGFDPSTWESAVAAPFIVGNLYEDKATGYVYRYVQNHATDGAWAAGGAIVLTAAISNAGVSWVCTMSKGASQLSSTAVVGLAVRAVAVAKFGFVMVNGQYAGALNAANNVTNQTPVISGNATLGNWVNVAAATTPCAGCAQANASGGVFPMMVRCL